MKTRIKIVKSDPDDGQLDIRHLIGQEFEATILHWGGARMEYNGLNLILNPDEFIILSNNNAKALFSKIAESDKAYISGGGGFCGNADVDLIEVNSECLDIVYFVEKFKYSLRFLPEAVKTAKISGNSITMTAENGVEYTLECFKISPFLL